MMTSSRPATLASRTAARGATADDDRPADPIKVVRIRMGTAEDAAAKAKAEKEKLLAEAKAGASGRFIYGNWD